MCTKNNMTLLVLAAMTITRADNNGLDELLQDLPKYEPGDAAPGLSILPKTVGGKTRKQDPNGLELSQTGYDRITDSMLIAQKRCNLTFGLEVSNEATISEYYNKYLDTLYHLGWVQAKIGQQGDINTTRGLSIKKETIEAAITACMSTLGPAATAMAAGLVMLKGLQKDAEKSQDGTVSLYNYQNLEAVNATFNMDVSGKDIGSGKFASESVTMGLYCFRVSSQKTERNVLWFIRTNYANLDFMVKIANLECANKQWQLKNGKESDKPSFVKLLTTSKKANFEKAWDAYTEE